MNNSVGQAPFISNNQNKRERKTADKFVSFFVIFLLVKDSSCKDFIIPISVGIDSNREEEPSPLKVSFVKFNNPISMEIENDCWEKIVWISFLPVGNFPVTNEGSMLRSCNFGNEAIKDVSSSRVTVPNFKANDVTFGVCLIGNWDGNEIWVWFMIK